MRERARSVGGSLLARHRPEGGFEVVAELPLRQKDFGLEGNGREGSGQEDNGGSTPVGSA
ncbi:hypothetical protein [Streptomyces sp. NPDC050982]|uniref:hypothetical protein n=1 Tax=Streptomyces sp. NPDC050982 TaxID=3154746 RepID=UPI00340172AA